MNAEGSEARLVDGRFELQQRLGGGGMGLVWRAWDNALHREVALKEVRPPDPVMAEADPAAALELRERVLREARALARLQHPNVAVIHHIVDTPQHPHPWLVMELVAGGSLADRLARGPLAVPEAARIGRGVLSALRAAHAAGVQHRDVKPGNVLLRADGTPVLTDFGIAAVQGATALTATGALIGSPEYIAPERIRGEEGNPSSDLWSLGMMLYVALEGHHPLRRGTTLATLAAVLDEPLPPPTRAGRLGPLLSALLARDPAVRPDAEQLDRALAAAESGAPPAAWAPTDLDLPRPGGAAPAPGGPAGAGPVGTNPYDANPYDASPYGTGRYDASPYGAAGGFGATGGPQGAPGPYGTGPHAATGSHAVGPYDATGPYGPVGYGAAGPYGPEATTGAAVVVGPGEPPGAGPVRVRRGRRLGMVALPVAIAALAGAIVWSQRPDTGGGSTASGSTAGSSANPGAAAPAAPPQDGSAGGAGGTGGTGSAAPVATPTSGGKAPAAPTDLITPAGVRTTVDAMRPQMADTRILTLTVYPTYASAEAPTAADPKLYDRLSYRDGKVSRTPGGAMSSSKKTVDLKAFDWEVIPGLLTKAQETLNVPSPTSRYLIIGPDMSDGSPSIRVYLSDAYGGGYLAADAKGKVTRTYPRGS